MQDLTGKITGSSLTASEWNQLPQEVQNIIVATAQTLTNSDLNQLGKAAATIAATGDFYSSSGPADAYVLSVIGALQAPPFYFNGMRVRFIPNAANTGGGVTVNVAGLGIRTVVREDAAGFSSDTEFQVGVMVELRYDSGAGDFKLLRIPNAGTADNEFGLTRVATQTDVDNGTEPFDYVTPATLNSKTATETRRGVAELATNAEVQAGSDTTRIVTPSGLTSKIASQVEFDAGTANNRLVTPLRVFSNHLVAPLTAYKTADTSRASTTALASDPHLSVSIVQPNSIYDVELMLYFTSSGGGVRVGFLTPASMTISYIFQCRDIGTDGDVGQNEGLDIDTAVVNTAFQSNAGAQMFCWFKGTITTGGSGGSVTLRWAQESSNASATVLNSGSTMKMQLIG